MPEDGARPKSAETLFRDISEPALNAIASDIAPFVNEARVAQEADGTITEISFPSLDNDKAQKLIHGLEFVLAHVLTETDERTAITSISIINKTDIDRTLHLFNIINRAEAHEDDSETAEIYDHTLLLSAFPTLNDPDITPSESLTIPNLENAEKTALLQLLTSLDIFPEITQTSDGAILTIPHHTDIQKLHATIHPVHRPDVSAQGPDLDPYTFPLHTRNTPRPRTYSIRNADRLNEDLSKADEVTAVDDEIRLQTNAFDAGTSEDDATSGNGKNFFRSGPSINRNYVWKRSTSGPRKELFTKDGTPITPEARHELYKTAAAGYTHLKKIIANLTEQGDIKPASGSELRKHLLSGAIQPDLIATELLETKRINQATYDTILQELAAEPAAMEELVQIHDAFVRRVFDDTVAHFSPNHRVNGEDVMQAGRIGLIKALRAQDLEKYSGNLTFFRYHIENEMRRLLRKRKVIRVPEHQSKYERKFYGAIRKISKTEGPQFDLTPTLAKAIAKQTGLTPQYINVHGPRLMQSVAEEFDDEQTLEYRDRNPDAETFDPHDDTESERAALEADRSEVVAEALNTLTGREDLVLRLRFGLIDGSERWKMDDFSGFSSYPGALGKVTDKLMYLRDKDLMDLSTFARLSPAERLLLVITGDLPESAAADLVNGGFPNELSAITLEDAGSIFGVTRDRIRQIEAKALRKLKHPARTRKLGQYLP